jgi:hypothetical protein
MNERQEILELLAKGKISADEAADLLSSVAKKGPEAPPAPEKPAEPVQKTMPEPDFNGKKPSWFKVRVRNLETGKNKVTVNIPLGVVDFGLKLGRYFAPELDDLNYKDLAGMMKNMESGMLVEVEDEEDNEHVQIFVE